MKRVLFVDEDPGVLDGMRRVLRGLRREWDMHFVDNAVEALERLDSGGRFDVLVSEMCMPGMDGAQLLEEARNRHPAVVRIILSGRTQVDLALRMATCAHQFLTKPCDSDVLRSVVTRSIALHQRLRDERLKEVVGRLRTLPALPRTYLDLSAAMASEEVTIAEVAAIVERDSAVAVKILQLVNSSFFGLQRDVNSLRDAVSFLGLTTIKSLVLQYGVLEEFRPEHAASSFSILEHQRHSLNIAQLAREILSDDKRLSERAFVAGILHDIGHLVLAAGHQEVYERVRRVRRVSTVPVQELERRAIGVSHADVGAYLLGLWGMPDAIVEVALHHHRPSVVPEVTKPDALVAVHVAEALLHAALTGDDSRLDRGLVRSLGLSERLPAWIAAARAVVSSRDEDGSAAA